MGDINPSQAYIKDIETEMEELRIEHAKHMQEQARLEQVDALDDIKEETDHED